jgi:hypothetical protein
VEPIDFQGVKYYLPDEIQGRLIREKIQKEMSAIKDSLDLLLKGVGLNEYKEFILLLTGKTELPHWFNDLLQGKRPKLQNVKAIGTMIEYLFACVIKTLIVDTMFHNVMVTPNPSRGIDLPSLNIDIKAPGKRLDKGPGTSTRAHSPFERLFGLDYHCVVLHTNLKTELEGPLRILRAIFLHPYELGDNDLSSICDSIRNHLISNNLVAEFEDLCMFLTFCRRDDKRCNQMLKEFREIASLLNSEVPLPSNFDEKLDFLISKSIEWIQEEDGKNFSLRRPNETEMRKLSHGNLGGRVTVSFKNELFLQFRQLLEWHDLNPS